MYTPPPACALCHGSPKKRYGSVWGPPQPLAADNRESGLELGVKSRLIFSEV